MKLASERIEQVLQAVKFDERGLATAIVLDDADGRPLMLAWMNRESLTKTLAEGQMCYWSRSRQELWLKGATSGHTQAVQEVRIDCDGDALLFRVTQKGGACHTGHHSCFYRRLEPEGWQEKEAKEFDPDKVYTK